VAPPRLAERPPHGRQRRLELAHEDVGPFEIRATSRYPVDVQKPVCPGGDRDLVASLGVDDDQRRAGRRLGGRREPGDVDPLGDQRSADIPA